MAPRPPEGARDARFHLLLLPGLAGGFTRLPHALRVAICLALAVGLYALLGFTLVPALLRRQAIEYVREHYGRQLRVGAVRVQPFALRIEVDHLALPDADGHPMVSWEHASVNFEAAASLWQRAYVLHEIVLRGPVLRAISRVDGQLNLADLSTSSESARKRPAAQPPALSIGQLTVTHGKVEYIDRARSPEFVQTFSPVSFSLRDFHTTVAGGAFALRAESAPNARFWWKGDLSFSPALGSSGRFAVANLSAAAIAEFLDRSLPFEVSEGLLSVAGTYRARLGNRPEAELHVDKLELDDVALHVRGSPQDSVAIPSLVVDDATFQLRTRELEVGALRVRGLSTRAVLEHSGSVNLARLFVRPEVARADDTSLRLRVHQVALLESEIELADRAVEPPVEVTLAPLELTLREVTLDPLAELPLTLHAVIDEHCALHVTGSATPGSGALSLSVQLSDAHIARLQPYVQRYADLTVRDGQLDWSGTLSVTPRANGPAGWALAGDVLVRDLKTTDNLLDEPFVDIGRLELSAFSYRDAPESLHIERISVHEPYARLVLSRQQQLNMAAILHGGKQTSMTTAAVASGSLSAAHPLAKLQLHPTDVQIGEVSIDGMRLSFTDYFIKPNFSAELHGLSGKIEALSSDVAAQARVSLAGRLGTNAPVKIAGTLRPFAYQAATDLRLSWENVQLAVFNPYSDRFAGYSIVRGDLASALHYKLKNGKLDAQHHIRLDQLTWGDATDTKESAGLPVRLATAMLRDRNGVIALDIPVQGSLNDPTFRVGPLVWQAVENVAVRAATAPFEWLGSLFEGAERARYVDFVPGDASLSVDEQTELHSLAKALVARPKLQVDVPLGVDRELDRLAIAERKYQSALRTTTASELWGKQKGYPYVALERGDKLEVLEALYEKLTGKEPALPEPPAPPANSSWSERRAFRKDFAIGTLERMTRAAIEVQPVELEELGVRRADAIEQTLIADGQLDTTRVLISSTGRVRGQDGKVRLELALQ